MKIVADLSKCVGAGQCVLAAPEIFGQGDDDGLVVIKRLNPSEAERQVVDMAVRSCPSLALGLVDD